MIFTLKNNVQGTSVEITEVTINLNSPIMPGNPLAITLTTEYGVFHLLVNGSQITSEITEVTINLTESIIYPSCFVQNLPRFIQFNQSIEIKLGINPNIIRAFGLPTISSCSVKVKYQQNGVTLSAPQSGQPLPVVNGRTAILQQTPQGIIDLV